MLFDVGKAISSHLICGSLHLTSTIILRAIAGDAAKYTTYVSSEFWAYTDWRVHCYNVTAEMYTPGGDCGEQQEVFSVVPPAVRLPTPVNLLAMALVFTLVSSGVHFASALRLYAVKQPRDAVQQLRVDSALRFLDYAVSASVMLSLLNVVFGANCVAGVIVAPIGLGISLALAAVLQWYRLPGAERPMGGAVALGCFAVLVLLYVLCLLPTMVAMSQTAKAAPVGVLVFMAGMLIAFTSFVAPYTIELVRREYCMFSVYATLSVVAKAILHAFLGVSVLQQAKLYEAGPTVEAGGEPPEDIFAELQNKVYAILFGTVAGGAVLYVVLRYKFDPFTADGGKGKLRQDMLELELQLL
jgi:hypothetical protein